MLPDPPAPGRDAALRWTTILIIAGAGIFILGLAVSAILDPRIRVLHTLQVLPYFVIPVLAGKNSPWGLGAGTGIAVFWNYLWLHQVSKTPSWTDPSLLMTLLPAGGHFAIITGCVVAFLRTRPGIRHCIRFSSGGVISVAYLVAIVVIAGPQYIGLLKQAFGL
jgi:hypothetical protein